MRGKCGQEEAIREGSGWERRATPFFFFLKKSKCLCLPGPFYKVISGNPKIWLWHFYLVPLLLFAIHFLKLYILHICKSWASKHAWKVQASPFKRLSQTAGPLNWSGLKRENYRLDGFLLTSLRGANWYYDCFAGVVMWKGQYCYWEPDEARTIQKAKIACFSFAPWFEV